MIHRQVMPKRPGPIASDAPTQLLLDVVGRVADARTTCGGDSPAEGDHRTVYRDLRNWLAGQALGTTRDEPLLEAVVRALFARHWMTLHPDTVSARESLRHQYVAALGQLNRQIPGILNDADTIALDDASLEYVDHALASLNLDDPQVDLIGDAYQLFAAPHLRAQEGQFFTPQGPVSLLLDLVNPQPGETLIDPACGAGGFLLGAANRMLAAGATPAEAVSHIWGQDKDDYLARLARARLSFLSMSSANVACADSLGWRTPEGGLPPASALEGRYDIVVTNPPFGAHIVAASKSVQGGFDLGHGWTWSQTSQTFARTTRLPNNVSPQVLFLERCLRLVRPGGRVGIVVPESLISGRNYRFVVAWLRDRAAIRAVVGMPEALFKTSGKSGTHTKTCLVLFERLDPGSRYRANVPTIFMAEAKRCGNDSRGRRDVRDELPTVSERWRAHLDGRLVSSDHLGYPVPPTRIVDDVLAPRYYDPDVQAGLDALRNTHELVTIGQLVRRGVLVVTTGHEVGAQAYGTGPIPFVRTSDISNWEIKLDPKHGVSEAIYHQFAQRQDIREGDILMVRDGTYLIGTCAFITKFDTRIVFQSHIYKLRVLAHDLVSPYLLLAALSSAPVRRQIKAKRFTQDIIDSLGNRLEEIVLPLPKDRSIRRRVEGLVETSLRERAEARELARRAQEEVIRVAAPEALETEDAVEQLQSASYV